MEKELDPRIYGGPHRPNRWQWVGIIAFILLLVLYINMQCNRPLPPAPTVVPIAVIKDSVQAAKERAQQTIDSITQVAMGYRKTADSGKVALAQLKARGEALLSQAEGLKSSRQNGLPSETLRAGVSHFTTPPNDYEGGDKDAVIAEQAQIIKDQDSACTITIEALEGLAVTKDGIITAKDTLLAAMDRQLAVALTNQASLQTYTKQLRKAAKRARFGRGFWRTAAVVLGGVVAWQSIK